MAFAVLNYYGIELVLRGNTPILWIEVLQWSWLFCDNELWDKKRFGLWSESCLLVNLSLKIEKLRNGTDVLFENSTEI